MLATSNIAFVDRIADPNQRNVAQATLGARDMATNKLTGLYLRVAQGGTRSWVYRYMLDHKPHWMGLGPYPLFSLADARAKALDARRLRYDGN